ncbi:MAG: hypothetical protein ACLFPQ_06385 [Candidatus Woesearchaeota archaeon]
MEYGLSTFNKSKKGTILVLENLVVFILSVVVFISIVFGVFKYVGYQTDQKSISSYNSLLSKLDSLSQDQLDSGSIILVDKSALVFFNSGTDILELRFFRNEGNHLITFERPENCNLDMTKTCACLMRDYDEREKKFNKISCELKNFLVTETRGFPLSRLIEGGNRNCRSKYSVRECSQLQDEINITNPPVNIFTIDDEQQKGVVIDSGITNGNSGGAFSVSIYKHGNEVFICPDYDACRNFQDMYWDEDENIVLSPDEED